ncbi:hypothetical protein CFIICLFH_4994 [Methylobacterium goesingense]|nr:hypothetical protein CFIICLFH_4994 [Methylobacterium goesingense]
MGRPRASMVRPSQAEDGRMAPAASSRTMAGQPRRTPSSEPKGIASARSPWKPIISQGTAPRPFSTAMSSRPPRRMAATGPATSTRSPRMATTRPKVSSTCTSARAARAPARRKRATLGSRSVIGDSLNHSFTSLLNTVCIGLVAGRRLRSGSKKSSCGATTFRCRGAGETAHEKCLRAKDLRGHADGPRRAGKRSYENRPSTARSVAGNRVQLRACIRESGFVND